MGVAAWDQDIQPTSGADEGAGRQQGRANAAARVSRSDRYWLRRQGPGRDTAVGAWFARRVMEQVSELVEHARMRRLVELRKSVRVLQHLTAAMHAPGLSTLVVAVEADANACDWAVATARAESLPELFARVLKVHPS